jgi:hypothetical protein
VGCFEMQAGSAGIKRDEAGRGSRLIRIFLAKPIPNRRLQICESVKAPVAENNVHSGATAKAERVNQPWGAGFPAMLTGASIAHAATIANGIFEASASRRSHGDLVVQGMLIEDHPLLPVSDWVTGWRGWIPAGPFFFTSRAVSETISRYGDRRIEARGRIHRRARSPARFYQIALARLAGAVCRHSRRAHIFDAA